MSIHTIVGNYNVSPAAAQAHIHVAADVEMMKDGDSSTIALSLIGLHHVTYETAASPYKCTLHEPYTLPSILLLPTIMNHQQRLRLIFISLNT